MKYSFFVFFFISLHASADWKFSGSSGPYATALNAPDSEVAATTRSGIEADFRLDNKFSSIWSFKSDLYLRTDFVSKDSQEFFQFIPKSFYFQRKSSSWNMKFGFQTVAVDGPDIVNPADILQAKNWVDPTAPLTMSSAGVSLEKEWDEWNFHFFYVPRQTTHILPGERSAWLPREHRLPIESENTELRIPDDASYQYVGAKELNDALSNNFSMKIQNKIDWLETQILYYNGLSHSPYVTTQITGTLISLNPQVIQVNSAVKLRPIYYRHEALVGTFLLPFETWAMRGGINWLKPLGSDERIPGETKLMTLGIEKSFESSLGTITTLFDYVRQERQDENQISFLRSIMEKAITFGARVPLSEETTFYAGGLYDLVGSSTLLKASASHRLSNSWSMEGQVQFLEGPKDTLLGLYERHDSVQLRFQYSW